MNFRRGFQLRSECGLVLNPRLSYETGGTPDAEVATPAFKKQGLPRPSLEAPKELKFFKVKNLKCELYMQSSRLKVQVQSSSHLHSKDFELEFKINQLALHQEV